MMAFYTIISAIQDLFYYIQADDAKTPRYRIRVVVTPVINVRTVTFDYPPYTGPPPRTVERQGDLKSVDLLCYVALQAFGGFEAAAALKPGRSRRYQRAAGELKNRLRRVTIGEKKSPWLKQANEFDYRPL